MNEWFSFIEGLLIGSAGTLSIVSIVLWLT